VATETSAPDLTAPVAPLAQEAVVAGALWAAPTALLAPADAAPAAGTPPGPDADDLTLTVAPPPPDGATPPDATGAGFSDYPHVTVAPPLFDGGHGSASDPWGGYLGSRIVAVTASAYFVPSLAPFHATPQDHDVLALSLTAPHAAATTATPPTAPGHDGAGASTGSSVTSGSGSGSGTGLLQLPPDWHVTVAGSDTLTLAPAGSLNLISLLVGGTGADTVILTAPVSGGTIDLGGGIDTVTLANGANSLTLANTESVVGGSGADTLVLSDAGGHTVTGGGNGDLITSGGGADVFKYVAATDSFTTGAAAADANTDQIINFHDSGPSAKIDFAALAGAGTESFAGAKTGATFAAAFAGDAANTVDYAVIGGNTFVHVAGAAGGYSATDVVIELRGTHVLTAANLSLHP
jgi:hypothetical protein